MAELIVSEFVTLDGVMEAPGGEPTHPHTGWTMEFATDGQQQYKFDEIVAAESHLLGRVTYESFAGAWPTYEGPFADKMNAMPKYVLSSTLRDPAWNNTTVLTGELADEVGRLKAETEGPILVAGSCSIIHQLLPLGLVDEWRLMVFPVTIGAGLRVFPDKQDKIVLRHDSTQVFGSGVAVHTYRPAA